MSNSIWPLTLCPTKVWWVVGGRRVKEKFWLILFRHKTRFPTLTVLWEHVFWIAPPHKRRPRGIFCDNNFKIVQKFPNCPPMLVGFGSNPIRLWTNFRPKFSQNFCAAWEELKTVEFVFYLIKMQFYVWVSKTFTHCTKFNRIGVTWSNATDTALMHWISRLPEWKVKLPRGKFENPYSDLEICLFWMPIESFNVYVLVAVAGSWFPRSMFSLGCSDADTQILISEEY